MSEEIKGVVKVVNTEEGACIKISGKLDEADLMVIASAFTEMLANEYGITVKQMAGVVAEINRECPLTVFKEEEE